MRALVVDADARAALAICMMLQAARISAERVGLAKQALESGRMSRFDILLLDLVLPDLSGGQLVRRMRSAWLTRPMLVLSRLSQPQARTAAMDAGADGYLQKPFGQSELLARIRRLLPLGRSGAGVAMDDGGSQGVVVPLPIVAPAGHAAPAAAEIGATGHPATAPRAVAG